MALRFKVANVITTFNSGSGGPPRTVTLIARAGLGLWDAELFTTDYVAPHADTLLLSEFPGPSHLIPKGALTVPGGIVTAMGFSRALRTQLVNGSRPDIVNVHGLWSPLLFAYARMASAAGIPTIVAPHGMLEPWSLTIRGTRKRFALKTYQGSVLNNAAAIHTTSDAEAQHVRDLGFTRTPIFVIPNAVAEPQVAVEEPQLPTGEGAWCAKTGGADGERKVLLFLSRIHEKKGLDILLRAWNTLRPSQWELRIVGAGDAGYVAKLKEFCSEQHIPNVQFHDHVDGVLREAMFARATAFVLPTYSENFGNAVAEALIRGLPVITTTGTPWSVIAQSQLGWYIEPNQEQLTQALKELFETDPAVLQQMGIRARHYAKDHLLISAVRPRLLDMYQRVLRP